MGGGVGYLLWFSYAVGTEIIWFSYSCSLCSWLDYYASVLSWQLSSHAKQAVEPRGILADLTCPQSSRGSAAKEYSTCLLILSDAQAVTTLRILLTLWVQNMESYRMFLVKCAIGLVFINRDLNSLDSKTRTRSKRISQYSVVLAREPASFRREYVMAVVSLLRRLAKMT